MKSPAECTGRVFGGLQGRQSLKTGGLEADTPETEQFLLFNKKF